MYSEKALFSLTWDKNIKIGVYLHADAILKLDLWDTDRKFVGVDERDAE